MQQFNTCDDIHTDRDLKKYGANLASRGRILTAFSNVCDMDDTINNTPCTIWRVGKGNNTTNGLKYNLCEGYYALNGIRVIAWLNFNSYVRTHFCIDIK